MLAAGARRMSPRRRAGGWRVALLPGLRVLVQAVRNYIAHQSANQAGSVAFSAILSLFPLMLLLSAAAAFIGKPGTAAALASRVLEYAPAVVARTLKPAVDHVLGQRSLALLAIGSIVTVWTASSGTQAIRTALNRAYGIERGLSFWRARLKVTAFTVVGGLGTVFVFGSVIILPAVWQALRSLLGQEGAAYFGLLRDTVRYGLAFAVILFWYCVLYGWLPDMRQRWRTVVPGALVGALLWLLAAAVLSVTLRSVGQLTAVYSSFAGFVATLVAFYVTATTLIFGAEVNAVLAGRAVPRPARRASDRARSRRS